MPLVFSFVMELKDKGWYAVRGVAERLAPFEQYAPSCGIESGCDDLWQPPVIHE